METTSLTISFLCALITIAYFIVLLVQVCAINSNLKELVNLHRPQKDKPAAEPKVAIQKLPPPLPPVHVGGLQSW